MFRRENTVPKMSFASSSVVRADCPKTGAGISLPWMERSEVGREDLLVMEAGRGSQRRL